MTFETLEESLQDGRPVELYAFARGATVWRYTSANKDVVLEGNTWSADTLSRSSVEATQERARNSLRITTRRNFPIADMFRVAPPTDVIAVTVYRFHRGSTETVVVWMGRVMNVEWAGAQATLTCEPVSTSMRRQGLRRLYQRQCPLVLYSCNCGVDRNDHDIATTIESVSGLTVTVAELLDRPYAGGYIDWQQADGNFERRFIRSFSGTTLTLSHAFVDIPVGAEVTVYPGCDHTTTTCSGVYSNLPNYGGWPFIPRKNPFDVTPIY